MRPDVKSVPLPLLLLLLPVLSGSVGFASNALNQVLQCTSKIYSTYLLINVAINLKDICTSQYCVMYIKNEDYVESISNIRRVICLVNADSVLFAANKQNRICCENCFCQLVIQLMKFFIYVLEIKQ